MKIQILSDLHLELGEYVLPKCNRDLLIVAGDINTRRKSDEFLTEQAKISPVLYILGNHEYYYEEFYSIIQYYKSIKVPNLYLLHNSVFLLENIRFLGCTLWTDIKIRNNCEELNLLNSNIYDFRNVKYRDSLFQVEKSVKIHQESVNWLYHELNKPFNGKTVVITHHMPSYKSIHNDFKGHPLNSAFASSLDNIMLKFKPDIWIHGHTHYNFDYFIGKTRVICNPRGFPHTKNPEYIENFILEI